MPERLLSSNGRYMHAKQNKTQLVRRDATQAEYYVGVELYKKPRALPGKVGVARICELDGSL